MKDRYEIIDIIPDGSVVQPAQWVAAADYAALEAENAKLRERIEQAPHDTACASNRQEMRNSYADDGTISGVEYRSAGLACNCWKSEL